MPGADKLREVIRIQTAIAKLGLDFQDVISLVAEETLSLVDADGAVIEMLEGKEMVYYAVAGTATPYFGLRLDSETSLSGLCVKQGEMMRCDDTERDPRVDQAATRKVGIRSMIVMPLKHEKSTVGVLKAFSKQPENFDQVDETMLSLLSDVIGASMYHARRLKSDELFHKATHDSLTNLANRSLFNDRLRNALNRCSREHHPLAVLIIDMDDLKQFNDNYGHMVGDAALRELSKRVKSVCRASDTVARLGGDEFAVLLATLENQSDVEHFIERIDHKLTQSFQVNSLSFNLKASIGAACFPSDGHEPDELIDLADRRMYDTKKQHKEQRAAR